MQKITLNVDLPAVNAILSGLGELPHKVAHPIVDSIIKQVQAQVQAAQPGDIIEQPEAPAA
jgi:hypothetical protein